MNNNNAMAQSEIVEERPLRDKETIDGSQDTSHLKVLELILDPTDPDKNFLKKLEMNSVNPLEVKDQLVHYFHTTKFKLRMAIVGK